MTHCSTKHPRPGRRSWRWLLPASAVVVLAAGGTAYAVTSGRAGSSVASAPGTTAPTCAPVRVSSGPDKERFTLSVAAPAVGRGGSTIDASLRFAATGAPVAIQGGKPVLLVVQGHEVVAGLPGPWGGSESLVGWGLPNITSQGVIVASTVTLASCSPVPQDAAPLPPGTYALMAEWQYRYGSGARSTNGYIVSDPVALTVT
jgi:hypothetical protein